MKVKSEKIDQERKNILQWSVVTFRADENQSNASENQKVDRQLPRRIANAARGFVLSLALQRRTLILISDRHPQMAPVS